MRNRQSTSRPRGTFIDNDGQTHTKANFEEAFGFGGYTATTVEGGRRTQMRGSYDENIRLAPYTYGGTAGRRRAPSADDVVSQSQEDGSYYSTPELGGKLQPAQSRQPGMPKPPA